MANEFSVAEENSAGFLKRLWIYQRERFPIFGHGILVASFSFSAIAYSRICRGAEGFVSWKTYLVGIVTTISLFLLVRIFDEFKDAEDDARYRKELPVPRGLISFRELAIMGVIVALIQIGVNAVFFPKMLIIWSVVIAYLLLMGKEFFVADWLKKHQFWYVVSHMFIIPLVDIYASGLDWLLEGQPAPKGLIFFFAVSYFNGLVLEIGRKIRTPEKESEGVLTYSSMLGANKACFYFISLLLVTMALAMAASWFAGYGWIAYAILSFFFVLCAMPAILFLNKKTKPLSKMIEIAAGIWTIAMYLTLGGVPMLTKILHL